MSEQRPRLGVIGVGSIGRHHARILGQMPESELVGVFDTDHERGASVAAEHGTKAYDSVEGLLADVDAVSVAVPTPAHAAVGTFCFDAGCDVLIEKPIGTTLQEADQLIAAAGEAGRLLQVGHVERFNPAVEALTPRIDRPAFIEIHRLGTFVERSLEVDVITDLMIHDIDIVHSLVEGEVVDVRAVGVAVLSDEIDIANARLEFDSGCIVNMTASRVSMNRVRKVRVFQPHAYFSVDYSDQSVAGYRLEDPGEGRASVTGVPVEVQSGEPLLAELADFVRCVRTREAVRVDGAAGRRALATALKIRAALTEPTGV